MNFEVEYHRVERWENASRNRMNNEMKCDEGLKAEFDNFLVFAVLMFNLPLNLYKFAAPYADIDLSTEFILHLPFIIQNSCQFFFR